MYTIRLEISILKDKTLSKVIYDKLNEIIYFKVSDSEIYMMYHAQDCCESVAVEDICGELDWLVGTPIVFAESRTNDDCANADDDSESFLWTFYEIATIKGAVSIRWYGTSNGYYSESVDFEKIIIDAKHKYYKDFIKAEEQAEKGQLT